MKKNLLVISCAIVFSLIVSIGIYFVSPSPIAERKEQEIYQSIKPAMSLAEVEKKVGKPLETKKIANQLISESRLYDIYQKKQYGYDLNLYLVVYYNAENQVVKTYIGR